MTRNGRFVAFRQPDGIHVVDSLGPTPHRRLDAETSESLAWVGNDVWWLDGTGTLQRPGTPMPFAERLVSIVPSIEGTSALVEGGGRTWLVEGASQVTAVEIDSSLGTRVLAIAQRRIVEAEGQSAAIRTVGKRDVVRLPRLDGIALAASFVLAGRAIAMWVRGPSDDEIVAYTIAGKLIHRIPLRRPLDSCTFAEDANLAIGTSAGELFVYDVRYGRLHAHCETPPLVELEVDRLARHVVTATQRDDGGLEVSRAQFDELFRGRPTTPHVEVADLPVSLPEPIAPAPASEPEVETEPEPLPLALAAGGAPPISIAPNGSPPYRDAGQHLEALLDVIAARTALAIAESWHSGRASHDDGEHPCEREVLGLIGEDVGLAADALRRARARLRERGNELRRRTEASLAAGLVLPFHQIVREYQVSPIATQILVCAAAPRLRTSIARLYGVLAGLEGRSACADHLLDLLVESEPGRELGHAIAVELAPDAPLVRSGLVHLHVQSDRTQVLVDAVLVDRLRGIHRALEISDATTRRAAGPVLEDVRVPAAVKRTLLLALADREPDHPRIVIRGRRGSGRHTLLAAIAQRVRRTIAAVDASRLPRGKDLAGSLATELTRASLAGCIPMVSGLEGIDRTDAETRIQVQAVLRRHPGPLAVRSMPDVDLPIDPERIEIELPPLSLTDRTAAWQRALTARALPVPDEAGLALLAARFRFGPGTIERISDQVAHRARRNPAAIASLIDEIARQHIAGRLERVATRITRLPDWDQVTLVDDMRDSVRELIGRMRHQRTVFEDWGFDRRIATARGLTALFYGPPGTGKTLVAGLIGRELELDVWRIDLARVTSKWVGETEKSLGEVFEAAEEGQVMLLFDEADSLFGKRSEVKSSNDRYANLETNYLLQRFDSFEGVAILTTNLDGSIDPAFKRRLSMRLYFPFPDEELRAQLWASHVPPGVPCTGTLDFADLARRFPLSGGYIRNSALRAAFLAAQERIPLTQDHLVRAVQLEYRELGKLSSSGRMD